MIDLGSVGRKERTEGKKTRSRRGETAVAWSSVASLLQMPFAFGPGSKRRTCPMRNQCIYSHLLKTSVLPNIDPGRARYAVRQRAGVASVQCRVPAEETPASTVRGGRCPSVFPSTGRCAGEQTMLCTGMLGLPRSVASGRAGNKPARHMGGQDGRLATSSGWWRTGARGMGGDCRLTNSLSAFSSSKLSALL